MWRPGYVLTQMRAGAAAVSRGPKMQRFNGGGTTWDREVKFLPSVLSRQQASHLGRCASFRLGVTSPGRQIDGPEVTAGHNV